MGLYSNYITESTLPINEGLFNKKKDNKQSISTESKDKKEILYCGCIKKYDIGSESIDNRTRFFKSLEDASKELIFTFSTDKNADRSEYDNDAPEIKDKDLNKIVYVYKVECLNVTSVGHAQYNAKSYKLIDIEFEDKLQKLVDKWY